MNINVKDWLEPLFVHDWLLAIKQKKSVKENCIWSSNYEAKIIISPRVIDKLPMRHGTKDS